MSKMKLALVIALSVVSFAAFATAEVYDDISGYTGTVPGYWNVSGRGGGTAVDTATASVSADIALSGGEKDYLFADSFFVAYFAHILASPARPLSSISPVGLILMVE